MNYFYIDMYTLQAPDRNLKSDYKLLTNKKWINSVAKF